MATQPTQVRLTSYPDGIPTDDNWVITHDPTPALSDGQIEIDVQMISIDPGMKGWISRGRSYMPPVQPGEVMRAFGVGPVVRSTSHRYSVGDVVSGFTGVQTTAVVDDRDPSLRPVDLDLGPIELHMSVLGMTGFTGYFGMLDLGRPIAGETVVVSAASGAVGAVAAQIAKRQGARVVGIAGGADKCGYLTEQLALDAAVDYRAGDLRRQMRAAAPGGVDVYFDNVGGDVLETVLSLINRKARLVICGAISQYEAMGAAAGPANYLQLVAQSATMVGFTMLDYLDRLPEAIEQLSAGVDDGTLQHRQHILEGIEQFPTALPMLFTGENHGKLLLRV